MENKRDLDKEKEKSQTGSHSDFDLLEHMNPGSATSQNETLQDLSLFDQHHSTHTTSVVHNEFCVSTLNSKQSQYLNQHDTKITLKITQQQELQQNAKKLTLKETGPVIAHMKVIHNEIIELKKQRQEFVTCCDEIKQELISTSTCMNNLQLNNQIERLHKKFSRECIRLFKALPIYARRSDIVEAVQTHQVIVLIGETGSGKSTQVVQYLYDTGFCNDDDQCNLIACTQPRKMAAISLANHVSTEMCCSSLGDIVGYRVGTNTIKMSPRTRIVYMTDHALLNECIADPLLMKYSCLVIDEAHERSLDTDILLACIKQCLTKRHNLRVIITSATIDPDVFIKYFGGSDVCPVVKVSGRMFPVDVVWSSLSGSPLSLNSDVVISESVNMIKRIHTQEPPGDILVFLTSPRDIEAACQMASEELVKSEVNILPLHGRLQPDEQRLVFEECHNKRKIVFSTNVAETSVTIPGIKYIVDTGLAKEMSFDPKRNMNSLEVCLISKSSAEQRKGRAGRVSAGKCYRLYTEEEYDSMRDRTPPEILRIHLIHAVLKLYEFGIVDVLLFDFVETPDECALQSAMETLHFLGATVNNQLTPLGHKLALFPLDPQLSKVLLDAIEVGIGLEGAVSVAISSFGSNVFFRNGSEEMKKESDKMKLQFLHSGGDQMTCLSVYREWSLRKREDRNRWCVKNYVNAKTMRLVEESFRELCHILSSKLQINLQGTTPSLSKAETLLPKLYFYVFLRKLGVYLGHPRIGYSTLSSSETDEPLSLFPGSSLFQRNETPKYVIYEKTLKTSQHFLLQVLPVNEVWIDEAIAQGKLSDDPVSLMKDRMVCPFTIEGVGTAVSISLKREAKELVEEMKLFCKGAPVQLDWTHQELGRLLVYSASANHKPLKEFLTKKLLVYRNKLLLGFHETGVTCPQDTIRVVLSQGGLIQHLLMSHEYRTAVVIGPSPELIEKVSADLYEYGDVITTSFKQFKNESKLYITYSHPSMAAKAVFSKTKSSDEVIKVVPSQPKGCGNHVLKPFRLKVEWLRRERKNFAFLDFNDINDFSITSSILCNRAISVCGSTLRCRPSNNNSLQLFLSNVPTDIDEDELRDALDNCTDDILDDDDDDETIEYKVKFGHEKSFETTPDYYYTLHVELDRIVSNFVSEDQYKINLLEPSPQHIWYKAFVDFKDPSIGHRVMTLLDGQWIFDKVLDVTLMLSTSVRFTPNIYQVIQEELEIIKRELVQQFKTKQFLKFVNKPDKFGNMIVEIQSDDLNVFAIAKTTLNNLICPLVKECNTPLLRHYILAKVSRNEFDKIESTTMTVILTNTRTMTISIYGTKRNRDLANTLLDQHMIELEKKGLSVHELQLKAPGRGSGLMKYMVSKYGIDLSGILSMKGVESATLEPRRQLLTVFSTNDAFGLIEQVADKYSLPVKPVLPVGIIGECSICLCEIEDVSHLFILEYCGHASHIECIQLQVSANAVSFPLQCAAEGCQHNFVWQDCENLFKKTSLTLQTLLNTSLRSFLATNRDKARNCLTPDCPMVYGVSDNGQRFVCSCCNVHICTTCHVQYHDGLTCTMYNSGQATDKQFQEWLHEDTGNRKICPRCTAPIEKNEGCNHIHCIRCRTNICWVCLKYFEDEQQCYTHLRQVHKGIQ